MEQTTTSSEENLNYGFFVYRLEMKERKKERKKLNVLNSFFFPETRLISLM